MSKLRDRVIDDGMEFIEIIKEPKKKVKKSKEKPKDRD